jgi:hypothetical protein
MLKGADCYQVVGVEMEAVVDLQIAQIVACVDDCLSEMPPHVALHMGGFVAVVVEKASSDCCGCFVADGLTVW